MYSVITKILAGIRSTAYHCLVIHKPHYSLLQACSLLEVERESHPPETSDLSDVYVHSRSLTL